MAQQSQVCCSYRRPGLGPAPTWGGLQQPVTPTPGGETPSSHLYGLMQSCVCTHNTHNLKIFFHVVCADLKPAIPTLRIQ